MGASEIGRMLGVTRQRAYQIIVRRDFPEPIAKLALGQVWLADDVEEWYRNRPARSSRPDIDAPDEL